jgi:hypothetical protein
MMCIIMFTSKKKRRELGVVVGSSQSKKEKVGRSFIQQKVSSLNSSLLPTSSRLTEVDMRL